MKKFDLQHIFGYILRDIETIALSSQEFGSTISAGTASKELQSPFKLLSNFLIDLSDLNHAFFSAYMSVIARYLDGNSYSLRIAALTIMGCFIVKDRDREVVSDRCGPETNDNSTIDVDGNQNTVANITHNKFYSYLKSHLYDANAFVRSKCFQILSKILTFSTQNSHPSAADEERCIMTNSRILTFAKLAHERLEDKSSNVRKNALQFLTHTICQKEVNIYLATAPEVLQAKIAAGHEKIARNVGDCARLVEQKMKADNETENCLMNGEHDDNVDKFTRIQVFKAEIEDKINEIRNMNKMDMEILEKMKFCVDHFNLLANQVYPHVIDTMLFSKSQTDCLEAIAFLVTGLKCKIYGSGMSGIKKCLQHLAISSSANDTRNGHRSPHSSDLRSFDKNFKIEDRILKMLLNNTSLQEISTAKKMSLKLS